MLLQFITENYRSLRDRTELSMMASTSLKDREEGLLASKALSGHRVLPSAVIYGANASGKSNLVGAIGSMRAHVLHSHTKGNPEGGVPRQPFALDPSYKDRHSLFEIVFITNGTRYQYGFRLTDDAFVEEWLFAFPNVRKQVLFHRTDQNFSFGRALKGRNHVIADLTRKNSLFVSAAAQNGHEELGDIYSYFSNLRINRSMNFAGRSITQQLKDVEIDSRIIKFLSTIGTGVVDFRRDEEAVPEPIQAFERSLMELVRKTSSENPDVRMDFEPSPNKYTIELGHRSSDGTMVYFDLDHESAGTRRLLVLLRLVFKVIDEGGTVIVDELDASLHAQACEAVLALFASEATNPNGAQIIATTHDTNILSSPLMRRDQIWFCEKNSEGDTAVFPLSDIVVKKTDNIEKGYLQGRFGAVPFTGSALSLVTREVSRD